ncbi:MAG: S8 family serine peptidase [Kofleriaceae bacterium]
MITLGTQRQLAATAGFALWLSLAGPAAAQSPPYDNEGLRWIGVAAACKAPSEWTAARVFRSANALPAALAELCLYTWRADGSPAPAQIAQLFAVSAAQQLTEDVPVLAPSAPFSAAELALLRGLRAALRAQVGDASLLPVLPKRPAVRIAVIDSAPDAIANHLQIGASRHGDTIAHLIDDLVCTPNQDGPRTCAAEVTTTLALPWIARGVIGANGGYSGTLADLARAIERAVATWQSDLRTAPATTPPRLILNLSVGWEHTDKIADCSTDPKQQGPASRAVLGILQQAAAQGALIIGAAGNDSGGPAPRRGLLCPARYQAVPQDADPAQSLVLAVSGVDYHDAPLESARPQGITAIAALGLGGVAWDPADPAPPQLIGSSVSAGVASAVAALVWAYEPGRAPGELTKILYAGGVEVGKADQCPRAIPSCVARRISACGVRRAARGRRADQLCRPTGATGELAGPARRARGARGAVRHHPDGARVCDRGRRGRALRRAQRADRAFDLSTTDLGHVPDLRHLGAGERGEADRAAAGARSAAHRCGDRRAARGRWPRGGRARDAVARRAAPVQPAARLAGASCLPHRL